MASPPLPSASPSLSPAPGRASRGGDHDSTAGEDKPPSPKSIPETLWALQVPLYITHSSLPNTPFVAAVPRFSYLAFLLPRLTAYFGMPCSSFHHEEIQLRNLPVGLLLDLYQPTSLPWRLVVGDGPEWDISDTFLNGAKEADFVRNNNAQQIMSLSKADTTALWNAVQDSTCRSSPSPLPIVPGVPGGGRELPTPTRVFHSGVRNLHLPRQTQTTTQPLLG